MCGKIAQTCKRWETFKSDKINHSKVSNMIMSSMYNHGVTPIQNKYIGYYPMTWLYVVYIQKVNDLNLFNI